MKTHQSDIAIMGGGVPGLTLGILLAGAGISCAIVEPSPPKGKPKPDGRTVALMNSSLNILKATGIWNDVKYISTPLQTMRLYDDSVEGQAPVISSFHAADIEEKQFGHNIPNTLLRTALWKRAKACKNLTLIAGSLADYKAQKDSAQIRLENKDTIQTRLIVGADGRSSKTRSLAGIDIRTKYYDQAALTFLISHEKPHENISTEFHRPSGPLALVPLPGNQCSVVWVEKKESAEELKALPAEEFEAIFQDKTCGVLGKIALKSAVDGWPLCAINAYSLTAGRTALIAEAAHVMSPITAQGLNLSLRDVATLAEIITDGMRAGIDPGAGTLLSQYQKARMMDVETRGAGVDGMMRLVSQEHPGIKTARRTGLRILDTFPPLKNVAMVQGLAPQTGETRLGRGEAL